MSLRVAMVGACPYPVPQGSQVFLRDTALCLRARGHDVHLVVYGYGLGQDNSGLAVHRCRPFRWARNTAAGPSFSKPFLDAALVATLRRIVREQRIDVVHAHNYEALIVALLAGKRPIVYHAHNAMSDELPYFLGQRPFIERFGRWLDRTFPRKADRVVVPHRRLAGHLIVRGCDHRKITVVPPPLDAALFAPCVAAKETPPVLYTGNLDAYQNLGLLFSAMERVRKAVPAARLQVATGDEAEIPGAEILPAAGFDALHRLLAHDSVLAVPRVSWSGYPIKLLNAMAAGKAIVACDSAAYPLTDGFNGRIVPDNDANAFADALAQLLTNPKLRTELGRNARETILREHSPAMVAQRLEAIDLELLGRAAPAPSISEGEAV